MTLSRGRPCAYPPLVAVLAGLLLCATALPGYAVAFISQEGLPPALVIDYQTTEEGRPSHSDLQRQITDLRDLAAWAREQQPRVGWTERIFGSPGAARPIPVDDLAVIASQMVGQTVIVHGLYEAADTADGRIRTDQAECLINLAEGARIEGFQGSDAEGIVGLPVAVEGLVEVRGETPLVRASRIRPSLPLSLLRIARAYEIMAQYRDAMAAYLEAEGATRGATDDLSAFAHISAGRVAYDGLRDHGEAGKRYNHAWTIYQTNVPADARPFPVWMPDFQEERWVRMTVRDAIGKHLHDLNQERFWYRFVAFFVLICGGHPAWGVLLLALVVRILIWPLTKKQLQSAEAMKKLQPQMKELQARFADDKQKFQQEFWKLCQANGVNPLGGCLPLLVQMPVLIMVYQGIRLYIVEFDQFAFLWMDNLAGPDMVLLIAYTISMILFQKMTQKTTPQAMDPQQEQQQKMMMYMMPLLFFFIFRTFPAAFILYWLGTNIIYFMQQWTYTRAVARRDALEGAADGVPTRQGFVPKVVALLSGEPAGNNPEGAPAAEEGSATRALPPEPEPESEPESEPEPDSGVTEEARSAAKKSSSKRKRRKRK